MKSKLIFLLILILIIIIYKSSIDIDDNFNNEFKENNFKELSEKKPLKIGKKKVYYIKTPNNLIYYKNVEKKNIIFLDDFHTYCTESNIKCDKKGNIELINFLRLFYKIKKKINLFIEIIHPSEVYKKYNNVIIENTMGFNTNNTITTIIDDNIFKECFYKGKKCKNFIIYSTDIRISNDMLINYYNLQIKEKLNIKEINDIILLTFNTPKNLYHVIFDYLKKKNKNPKKLKKYIYKDLNNEIYENYQKLNNRNKSYILDYIHEIYIPQMNSYNFIEKYIIMFMDLLTIIKILLIPKNEIVILYQGLYHNYYIRKFFDMYIKYDYKKRAEEKFRHNNKCIDVSKMDEIIL